MALKVGEEACSHLNPLHARPLGARNAKTKVFSLYNCSNYKADQCFDSTQVQPKVESAKNEMLTVIIELEVLIIQCSMTYYLPLSKESIV